jgi:flagellar hook-associated protein 2
VTPSISGLASGLDTASLINSLVSVQRNQQTLLLQQQASVRAKLAAYQALGSQLGTLSSQAADLANTSAWAGATATSSTSDVTAAATGVQAASLTFDVTAVAQAHTLISADTVSSTSAQAASGALTLTRSDGTTASISVGSGSLSDVVSGINNSNTGLVAAAVQTGPGSYRLQVASSTTGAASSFTLDGLDGFSSMSVLTTGADATLHLGGTSSAAYDVTSSTNTFANLVPGLSFTVSKAETGVTVASTVDGTAVANKVNTLVTTANSILNSISSQSAYSAALKSGGPLMADSTVRTLRQQVLSLVAGAHAPGVHVTRDGQVTFDQAAFLTAFSASPTKVAQAFGISSSFTAGSQVSATTATVSAATSTARAGTYAVQVTTPPAAESWQIDTGGADESGSTIAMTRGSTTISYQIPTTGETLAQTAASFNTVSAKAGFGVTASVNGDALQFTADNMGSRSAFTATLNGVAGTQDTAGTDIAGTIDGQTATGTGTQLSLPSGTGGAVGLSINVTTTAADLAASGGNIGNVTFQPGLAQTLVTLTNSATRTGTGSLAVAQSGAQTQNAGYQHLIDNWTTRLNDYRTQLTTEFTAMETAMATLKSQTAAIDSLTGSTSTTTSSSSSSLMTGTLNTG